MANSNPIKYDIAITIRVDRAFKAAVEEMRRMEGDPIPSRADEIRAAVFERLERKRKAVERRRNGR